VRGWCGVTPVSVGTLLYSNGTDVMVNFPECTDWKGLVSEIERVRTCILVGDKVKVSELNILQTVTINKHYSVNLNINM